MDLQFRWYLNIKQEINETKYNDKIELDGDGRNNVRILHSAQNHLCLVNKNSVPVTRLSVTANALLLFTWTSGSVIIMHTSSLAINTEVNFIWKDIYFLFVTIWSDYHIFKILKIFEKNNLSMVLCFSSSSSEDAVVITISWSSSCLISALVKWHLELWWFDENILCNMSKDEKCIVCLL